MLPNLFYLIVGTILNAVGSLFGLLNFVFPTATITAALLTLFSYLNNLGGIIDIPTCMTVLETWAGFLSVWYIYKLVLFIIHLTPIVGNPSHPTH